jgi:1-phosphofructokinase/tagatose 6-phosphate kinase
MPVISICLSPGFQRSLLIDALDIGEVNRIRVAEVDVSGKGINVARVLQRIGVDSVSLAQGGDNVAELAELARFEGLDLRFIASAGRLRTCTSIVEKPAGGGSRVTELVEPTAAVDARCVDALRDALRGLLPQAKALVIAGSMAPGFPSDFQAQLAKLAHDAGVPVLIDLHGAALRAAIVADPAVVKINLAEFAATFLDARFAGGEHSGLLAAPALSNEVTDAVAQVSRQYATSFVLTRGANSVLLARGGEVRVVGVPPLAARDVVNPIGSGDAFLAGLLAHLLADAALAQGAPTLDQLAPACALATACAQSNARTARPGFLEASFATGVTTEKR